MKDVGGSVGLYGGKQCYNFLHDQITVIDLLNNIPGNMGGRKERPLSKLGLRDRVVSSELHQQILTFQGANGLVTDGHIDPGRSTIRKLNQLSGVDPRPGIEIVVEKAIGALPAYIDKTIRALSQFILSTEPSSNTELAADAVTRFFRYDPTAFGSQGNTAAVLAKYAVLRTSVGSVKGDLHINSPGKEAHNLNQSGDRVTAAYAVLSDEPDEKAGMYINPSQFEPLNELRRTGIILHEMCHFFLQMPDDRDPRQFPALENIAGTVQSYDLTAFQINFGQFFRPDIK